MRFTYSHFAALAFVFLAIAPSARGQSSFNDGFEAPTLDPFWTPTLQLRTIAPSTDLAHSGTHSAKFTTSGGGQREIILSHKFSSAIQGDFNVYFYDYAPGQETLYEQFNLQNSATGDVAALGTMDFDANCYTAYLSTPGGGLGPNANCGIFPQTTTSNVTLTVTANYHGSTDLSCPSGYKAVAATCSGIDSVLHGQTPAPPTGSWASYLTPTATTATGLHCNWARLLCRPRLNSVVPNSPQPGAPR
jgi:hypothetical protein